jgi:hypothetical protein
MNTLTQTMDGSMVYGSTDGTAKSLRTFKGGFENRHLQLFIENLQFYIWL